MKYQDEKKMLEKENQLLNEKKWTLIYPIGMQFMIVKSSFFSTTSRYKSKWCGNYSIFQQLDKPTVEAVLNETEKWGTIGTNKVNIYSLSNFSDFHLSNYPIL